MRAVVLPGRSFSFYFFRNQLLKTMIFKKLKHLSSFTSVFLHVSNYHWASFETGDKTSIVSMSDEGTYVANRIRLSIRYPKSQN